MVVKDLTYETLFFIETSLDSETDFELEFREALWF
jgi:hypothetical protein